MKRKTEFLLTYKTTGHSSSCMSCSERKIGCSPTKHKHYRISYRSNKVSSKQGLPVCDSYER